MTIRLFSARAHAGLLAAASLAFAGGCDSSSRETDAPVPVAEAPAEETGTPGAPRTRQLDGIRFTVPAGWDEKQASSGFVDAEYLLSGEEGVARLTLSSAIGGAEANAARWIGQVAPGPGDPAPTQTEFEVDGDIALLVDASGTFDAGFPGQGGPQPGWRLLGAIIPLSEGHYFVKLTGPQGTVSAHEAEFREFVQSAERD